MVMSDTKKGARCERIVRRTDRGTPATVATKSQMRPLRTEIHISKYHSKREQSPPHLIPEYAS
jgi:hypothetical protein